MSNAIVTTESKDLIQFDESKVGLIKRTIAKDATDDELELFLHQCRRTGLDPLAKQIYFQKYQTKSGPQIAIITGIDGYRLVADRTGRYAGNDEPQFEGRVSAAFYKANFEAPAKATVTVWKVVGGNRCGFSASAYWHEYYPAEPKGHMWSKMPHVMLAKCAEAQALRKAFPADLSGVYTNEELQQADWHEDETLEAEYSEPKAPAPTNGSQPTGKPAPETKQPPPDDIENRIADVISEFDGMERVQLQTIAARITKLGFAENFHHAKEIVKKYPAVEALHKPVDSTEVTGEQAVAIVTFASQRESATLAAKGGE